jgi:hypothetical protein
MTTEQIQDSFKEMDTMFATPEVRIMLASIGVSSTQLVSRLKELANEAISNPPKSIAEEAGRLLNKFTMAEIAFIAAWKNNETNILHAELTKLTSQEQPSSETTEQTTEK